MSGFLNINKPSGMTSHDVVARVRRLVGRKVKVGHAGTLDPTATGVLPVAIGSATRLIEYLADTRKGYQATVVLGITTTTDDAEGDVLQQRPVPPLSMEQIETALAPLRGTILQVPPMYAAIHHQGQRLYDLARAGKTVERVPRPVTIDRLELVDLTRTAPDTLPSLTLTVECSKGTYIRALARDLGEALGCGAHLAALERTFVGSFTVNEAVTLAQVQQAGVQPYLLPPDIAVAAWPAVTLSAAQCQHIQHGRVVTLTDDVPGEWVRAHDEAGVLVALLRRSNDADKVWQPEKVFIS